MLIVRTCAGMGLPIQLEGAVDASRADEERNSTLDAFGQEGFLQGWNEADDGLSN
jgi:hypothetical protein